MWVIFVHGFMATINQQTYLGVSPFRNHTVGNFLNWQANSLRLIMTAWWLSPTPWKNPLKNDGVKVSWDDYIFPIYGKIKVMFHMTYLTCNRPCISLIYIPGELLVLWVWCSHEMWKRCRVTANWWNVHGCAAWACCEKSWLPHLDIHVLSTLR